MSGHLQLIKQTDAHGGPAIPKMGEDGYMKTPTTQGRFIIHSIAKHVSSGKYLWSSIAWGTPIRVNSKNIIEVQTSSGWKTLGSLPAWKKYATNESDLTNLVLDYYRRTLRLSGTPDKWVFNDFGHISVKYFRDSNKNRRMDGKESILGDFIHTTPGDEASTVKHMDINLEESHGCIHLKPNDIDTLIAKEYLKRGNTIEIHSYNEKTVPSILQRNDAKPFFEFHVFPGINKAAVYSVH